MLLDLQAQTTSRLGLEPIKDASGKYLYNGGIVPARLISFAVGYMDHTKGEFKDMKVPVLQAEFENFKLNPNDPDKFYTHTFRPVGTKLLVAGSQDMYEDRKEVDIIGDTEDLWKGIKHLLENLTGSPNYRALTTIPKADIAKYFDLPGLGGAKDRLDKYEAFFKYIETFVNGDGKDIKSQIVDADGKALPIWLKMTPNYDTDPKRKAKYYVISRFINQGVFEPMKVDKGAPVPPKILRVKPTESLELKATTIAAPSGGGFNPASGIPGGGIDPAVAGLLRG